MALRVRVCEGRDEGGLGSRGVKDWGEETLSGAVSRVGREGFQGGTEQCGDGLRPWSGYSGGEGGRRGRRESQELSPCTASV